MGGGPSQLQDPQESAEPRMTPPAPQPTSQAPQASVEPSMMPPTLSTNAEATKATTGKLVYQKYEAILRYADLPIDKSSSEKLYNHLYDGVFLNQRKMKFWVERKSNSNCFILFARDLSITWSDDTQFWKWSGISEASNVLVDVAELLNVCWLEVHGRFNTANLSLEINYEVVLIVMLKDPAYGWEVPVNLRLILADGSRQEHTEDMMEKRRGRWIEVPAGEFTMSSEMTGEMEISLYEYSGVWKRGLVIKGIAIRPKA